ncbi:MAG: hypothetical protein FJX68_18970 [Alphaproteobacteria bacterium]|nr:hypothetical protein [Alphaproteobacteria bacterium]
MAEYRDRWVDDPYLELPGWRMRFDRWLQRRVMTSAAGLVTVSEPWATQYRQKYSLPVVAIYNGFDPRDFPDDDTARPAPGALRILHAGSLYGGRRDPRRCFGRSRRAA